LVAVIPKRYGRYPEALGRHPEAQGRHPEALGRHPEALGRHPEALGRHPEALGRHPEAQRGISTRSFQRSRCMSALGGSVRDERERRADPYIRRTRIDDPVKIVEMVENRIALAGLRSRFVSESLATFAITPKSLSLISLWVVHE
jgi:hypothetical protein